MITVQLRPASPDRRKSYGVMWEGTTVHRCTGPNVHNPGYPHRVHVWDNTRRPQPDGTGWLDPHNDSTSRAVSVLLESESICIADPPIERDPYGPSLRPGDEIGLVLPDGQVIGPLTIETGFLRDPELVEPAMAAGQIAENDPSLDRLSVAVSAQLERDAETEVRAFCAQFGALPNVQRLRAACGTGQITWARAYEIARQALEAGLASAQAITGRPV